MAYDTNSVRPGPSHLQAVDQTRECERRLRNISDLQCRTVQRMEQVIGRLRGADPSGASQTDIPTPNSIIAFLDDATRAEEYITELVTEIENYI